MDLKKTFADVRTASRSLLSVDDAKKNEILLALANETERQADAILFANQQDLDRMEKKDPMYDRLLLSKERLSDIANDIRNVATLPSPLGRLLMEVTRPNGLIIKKISVPFGVIGIIYEARPNVGFDVFSLCFKSGNACILKGGTDAHRSNVAIVQVIHSVLQRFGIDTNSVALLPAGREATGVLLHAVDDVDVLIPRGSSGLIRFVRDNARVPVIETGAGICHTYFDEFGDKEKGAAIVFNAKTRRVSVCNALDCLIINETRLSDLPYICRKLAEKNVTIYADAAAYAVLNGTYPSGLLQPATEDSFGTEFQDYKMAVKTVADIYEAIAHITVYSSKHSEAIISENPKRIRLFETMVDAACVYSNASTAFTDGAQFGLGAEIGISTQKLHARGPMGLEALTAYKWIVTGNGQVRTAASDTHL